MLAPGRPAPDFRLPDLQGAETSLDQLLPHGPVLVVFFKVSCPTCQSLCHSSTGSPPAGVCR
jgi:Peroxiredoxin